MFHSKSAHLRFGPGMAAREPSPHPVVEAAMRIHLITRPDVFVGAGLDRGLHRRQSRGMIRRAIHQTALLPERIVHLLPKHWPLRS